MVSSRIPWAEGICGVFRDRGYSAETRNAVEDFLRGDPVAILLSLQSWDEPIHERASRLRQSGYKGAILVLGRISPDLTARQKLAENEAWFLPALSGPEDVAERVRMLC